MSCPCDIFNFPPRLFIPAGLTRLDRQIASFPEFRRALLHDVGATPALKDWRGRQPDDFGVMLLEMWAYVCDVTTFYDEIYADEAYVRTAVRVESLRKLIGLLGYRPRPAVGATADLAAFAEGRRAIRLPAGTAFRSGAFNGNPPQVFELTSDAVIHPLFNKWRLQAIRPATFGPAALQQNFLLCANGTVTAKKDELVLVRVGANAFPRMVTAVSKHNGSDGTRYVKVEFDSTIGIPANTAVSSVNLLQPGVTAGLWPLNHDPDDAFNTPYAYAYLDSVYRTVRAGQDVVFVAGNTRMARRITGISQQSRIVTPAFDTGSTTVPVSIPAAVTMVTKLTLSSSGDSVTSASISDIAVYLGFVAAGSVTVEALTTLAPTDSLYAPLPIEHPIDAGPPGHFQLEDKNNFGVAVNASLDYTTGALQLGQNSTWTPPLTMPVRFFGNIITATRGESVSNEFLGIGDGAQVNQRFKLKKNPLTYLPAPTQGNDIGVANTLKVYVDNVLWEEVPRFFNIPSQAQIYIVRENDDGESSVIFGDGIRGQRLPTGARVTAWYRFGAGSATPSAGGVHQVARPVKGLTSIRNPVAAYGGADAEPANHLRTYAPRSALLLGRAISLTDLEAVTAGTEGVRAAKAEWRWNLLRQRPVAQIYYIGAANLDESITQRLRGLTAPDTPIDVIPANPLPRTLAIQITINPRYLENDVLAQVRTLLMDPLIGLLAPERIGIGLALFRSRIYEFVVRVPGADAVADLQLNNVSFAQWGISPGAGNYFDFETGSLLLNGKDANG
jgi:hypothetical protein